MKNFLKNNGEFKQKNRARKQGGYILLTNTVLFMIISMVVVLGAVKPVVAQFNKSAGLLSSKQSYLVSLSAAEEAYYRLKTNKPLPASVNVALSSGDATIQTSDVGGDKTIVITSEQKDYVRNMQMSVTAGAGISFNYGLQGGNGGVTMGGGSSIIGNIYANGTINAISASITGTAIAANSSSLTADEVNETPTTPPTTTNFRTAAATQDFAQSFQVSDTNPISKVQFYLKKTGSPANATVIITANNGGSPASTAIASVTLSSGLVTTNFGWIEVVFPTPPSLIPGTTYWLLIQNGSVSGSAYYTIGTNPSSSYTNGDAKTGKYGGSWTTLSKDGYFRLYTGGISSYIGGAGYVGGVTIGASGVGDAWASNVRGASVQGNLYCTTGSNNNKACNTTHGLPPPQPLPFSDANIQAWKDDAAAGSSLGTQTIGWAGGTLGPAKITGNLTVNGGGTLTLTGPLWVTGTVTITAGGKVRLPADYALNSETIVADGTITISGGGSLGSGTAGSYLFVVSTSKCPNDINCSGASAINITGGAGAIAAAAQSGNVALSGGAALKAVVGNSITVTGGSSITYDSGLASPSFQSGPSGAYVLQSWLEN